MSRFVRRYLDPASPLSEILFGLITLLFPRQRRERKEKVRGTTYWLGPGSSEGKLFLP
jgi:hypothetical protein